MNKKLVDRINEGTSEELEYEKDKMKIYQLFYDSYQSQNKKKKKTLPVKVIGIHINRNASSAEVRVCAACQYRDTGWLVLVPAREMGFKKSEFEELDNESKIKKYTAYIKKMLNATIDVLVLAADEKELKVIASRVRAMKYIVERNYIKSDKNGLSRAERDFELDKFVEARVITIASSVVIVDVLGLAVPVIAKEVAWRYTTDLKSVVQVGEKVYVKIKELYINKETMDISIQVSIKEGMENQMLRNMKKYTLGSSFQGTVSGIRDGYYVQIGDFQNGIDVFCKFVNSAVMPNIGDLVLVTINIKDEEMGRVFGQIDEVIARANTSA